MRMRIVRGLLGILRMACSAVRVFPSFGCLSAVMMIVAEQLFNGAMRSRLQPKHDTACRYNAEADVDFWLPRNHTLNSLFAIPYRVGRVD